MRVLFVDDEVLVLEGLQRGLYHLRDRWSMTFVASAREALARLEKDAYDVLVTDMMMPEMDGAELILRARDAYPGLVRMALSGYAEFESTVRSIPAAQHYLLKPCRADVIEDEIERAYALGRALSQPTIRSAVGAVGRPPASPRIYTELVAALCNPGTSVAEVAGIIEGDPVVAGKVVVLANSASLRAGAEVSSVPHAAVHLGMNMLKNLVIGVEAFRGFEREFSPCEALEEVRSHGVAVASLASRLTEGRFAGEDAYLAGLLHDVGRLHMASCQVQKSAEAAEIARAEGCSKLDAEGRVFGTTHAEVGAFILNEWGLSYPVIEAVAYHHHPERTRPRKMDALLAVHLANALVSEQGGAEFPPGTRRLLQGRGLSDRLDRWRKTAKDICQAIAA